MWLVRYSYRNSVVVYGDYASGYINDKLGWLVRDAVNKLSYKEKGRNGRVRQNPVGKKGTVHWYES